MALLVNQNFNTPIGTITPSTYWRWVSLGIDIPGQVVSVTLYAYVDEMAFNSGKMNIAQRQYQLTGQDFFDVGVSIDGPQPQGLSSTIYNYIKTHDPFFENSLEV